MSLNNYITPGRRKRQKVYTCLGYVLTNFWTIMYYIHENKIEKNIDHKNFLQNAKQEFSCKSLESFSGKYYNMENKILDCQFEPVCTKQTHPNYSVGSNRDEGKIQYDWWSTHRSSHQRCSMKKGVLRNFAKFIGKYLCQSLFFFDKDAGLQLYLKRDSGTGVFLWTLQNF